MYLPINKIHWYIAIPIVLFIGIRGVLQYKKDKNRLNLYVGWIGLLYTACFVSYGIPVLITSNPSVINKSILLGDILQFLALFTVWLGVIRVYITKNDFLRKLAVFLDTGLLMASIVASLVNSQASLVQFKQISSEFTEIILPTSFWFDIITAFQYVGFILFGVYFIFGARQNENIYKKIRMYSIAFILTLIGLIYFVQPFLDESLGDQFITYTIAMILLASGITIFASIYLSRKNS